MKTLSLIIFACIPRLSSCEQTTHSKLRQYIYPNLKKCLYIHSDYMPYEVAQKCALDACAHVKKNHKVEFTREECLGYLKKEFPVIRPGRSKYTKEEYPYNKK